MEEVDAEISEMKLFLNGRARFVAEGYLAQVWTLELPLLITHSSRSKPSCLQNDQIDNEYTIKLFTHILSVYCCPWYYDTFISFPVLRPFLLALLVFLGVTKVPSPLTSFKWHNSTSNVPPNPERKSIQFSCVSLNLSPGPLTSLNKHLFSESVYFHKHKFGIPPVRCPYSSEKILQIWLKFDPPMH